MQIISHALILIYQKMEKVEKNDTNRIIQILRLDDIFFLIVFVHVLFS